METQLLPCNSDWLNESSAMPIHNNTLTFGYYETYKPYYFPVYYESPSRPIKLTLSEIEKLRKIAKADASIKQILSKFTNLIEITVDF